MRSVARLSREIPDSQDSLNLLLAERIEPQLGNDCPVILYDYPASQAGLAQVRDTAPPVAERFELYVRGIELANGYNGRQHFLRCYPLTLSAQDGQ